MIGFREDWQARVVVSPVPKKRGTGGTQLYRKYINIRIIVAKNATTDQSTPKAHHLEPSNVATHESTNPSAQIVAQPLKGRSKSHFAWR